ncbi:MAG TPA: LysR substrate-binding domain-containing protein, partial [Burkholderiales bacterium]|nr:LysR substrate-binding domain-containing protein [Burkholderiales bacterium]
MNLRQLITLCEIVDKGLKLSAAAQSLHRSQPSITRQMQELEEELGTQLFLRRRNKILGLTPHGREILTKARRIIREVHSIRSASENADAAGEFTIATTHTQARYALPRVIHQFKTRYPQVRLSLRQGTPVQCVELVARGTVDIAICTETPGDPEEIVGIPAYRLNRSVVVPRGHALLRVKSLTLEAVARYPIITYDQGFSARWVLDRAFSDRGLEPDVVLSAIDADVSKTYVEMGLGIAILATIAFDAARDKGLRSIDARHLFPASTLRVAVRRHGYLRPYMLEFIRLFAPHVTRERMDRAL